MESILQNLEYDFSNEDMPEKDDFECKLVFQTEKYKAAEKAKGEKQPEWKGKVVRIDPQNSNTDTEFSNAEELTALLTA